MSDKVTITPLDNGPLHVVGEVTITAPDGTVIKETSESHLCRCGQSANKPFCDGTHRKVGWTSA
jgi:CDGSH-type Zn-finger protein